MKHLSSVASATDIRSSEDETPVAGDSSPFDNLAEPIREALEKRGFTELTQVQSAVLAAGAGDRDLQISSQTGSGKTVAIGLALAPPLLEAATTRDGARFLRALVIVPTRELAVQVSEELRWLYASIPGLTIECVTGGSSVGQERRRLSARPTIVVGTPGRLNDHISRNAIDCRSVAEVVLDEADRMLDMGFREELESILDETPADRSTHLVSATFPPAIQKLARKYQNDPLSVEGTRLGAANQDIEHVGHMIRFQDRYATIVNLLLLAKDQRTLMFVNTRVEASELASRLVADGFTAAPISGELEQSERTRTLESFRTGGTTVLVATDVAARGLDISEVSMVIHTDAPRDAESYTHRAGRTGRAGRKGRSVLLASPQRRGKVEFLLRRAKVSIKWSDAPTAAAVEKSLAKRARKRLRESLAAAPEPTEKQLAHATALLEDMDAPALVACLVELAREDKKIVPRDVGTVTESAPAGRARAGRKTDRNRPERPRDRFKTERDSPEHARGKFKADRNRPVRRERNFSKHPVNFEINWGRRDGATPQRLVAMLCRRGDIESRMIGAIDLDPRRATFELS
jgi:ATP-dependent RNA helicase DeaD